MERRRLGSMTWTALLIVLILVVLAGATVWAQGGGEDPEGGRVSPIDGAAGSDDIEVTTLPDGPVSRVPVDPEGQQLDTTQAQSSVVEEVELTARNSADAAAVILFERIAGANFHPREATTTHQYSGAGCVSRTASSGFLVSDLQLPDGAEIDFLRLYFDDTSDANEAHAWLYAYDGLGGFTQVAAVSSSGAPGHSSAGSGFFSHTVDNTAEALGLVIGFDSASDSSVAVCGVRVRYSVPFSQSTLPLIMKQMP